MGAPDVPGRRRRRPRPVHDPEQHALRLVRDRLRSLDLRHLRRLQRRHRRAPDVPGRRRRRPRPVHDQNNMLSASFEIDSGDVATLAYHDAVADDEIYINMPLDADDSKYPPGSAQKGDFMTGALATEVGM